MFKNSLIFCFLLLSFQSNKSNFTVEDLTGRSTPVFYGKNHKMQKEVHKAFQLMQAKALKSGIQLKVVSSYRSYEHQKQIWTRKYHRFIKEGLTPKQAIYKIIEYSTIPGTSRHHWGTDIDIIDGNPIEPSDVLEEEHFEGNGVYVNLKKWMDVHASEFGFCLVYTDVENRKGFKYEPWHYSYMPIAKEMLSQYVKIDIQLLLKKDQLVGSDYFTDEFISQYINENILDINPDLK